MPEIMIEPTLAELGRGGPTLTQLEIDLLNAARVYISGVTVQTLTESGVRGLPALTPTDSGSPREYEVKVDPSVLVEGILTLRKFVAAHVEVAFGQLNAAHGNLPTS